MLKFFLYISKKEQSERLEAREQDKEKAWKLSTSDWPEHELYDRYTAAYEDALSRCSTAARALVHRPGRPQMVPQRRHRPGHRRRARTLSAIAGATNWSSADKANLAAIAAARQAGYANGRPSYPGERQDDMDETEKRAVDRRLSEAHDDLLIAADVAVTRGDPHDHGWGVREVLAPYRRLGGGGSAAHPRARGRSADQEYDIERVQLPPPSMPSAMTPLRRGARRRWKTAHAAW